MIFLADSSEDYQLIEKELRAPVGQLLTPLTRRRDLGLTYGIDNGAFAEFKANTFIALLERQKDFVDRCIFVTVPDVVASARRTNEAFFYWTDRIRDISKAFPLAYVAQDGIDQEPIPWDYIKAVFIGGSTWFKYSDHAKAVCRAAKLFNKWIHVGRVNSPNRWDYFEELGADSCDGTGLSRYSHMRNNINKPTLYDPAQISAYVSQNGKTDKII